MMAREKRTIDYLDLKIKLPASSVEFFEECLEEFEERFDYIHVPPKLRNGKLLIHSSDLISLIGYVDHTGLSNFVWKRFLNEATRQIQGLLNKTTARDYSAHYQWCLAALKTLKPGRFLRKSG